MFLEYTGEKTCNTQAYSGLDRAELCALIIAAMDQNGYIDPQVLNEAFWSLSPTFGDM